MHNLRLVLSMISRNYRPYTGGGGGGGVPAEALLTESGDPILTEDGQYILVE
jgi:hypothetical protein